mgnify:CR=1 FL=1
MHPDPREAISIIVGHRFANPELIDQALRHASVAEQRVASNERLEFLGDAVLGVITCQRVYELFPALLEGEMTKIKSAVVSRQACASMAKQAGLVQYLELGKGMRSSPSLPTSLSAAILEAVIGALYVDGGLEVTRAFLVPLIEPRIYKAFDSGHQDNYKSLVQQHAQQSGLTGPSYIVVTETGPDHNKLFNVCLQIGDRRFAPMTGSSKKQAEQAAARQALEELGLLSDDGKTITIAAPVQTTANGTSNGTLNGSPHHADYAPLSATAASAAAAEVPS